jgi:recombination protein RecT
MGELVTTKQKAENLQQLLERFKPQIEAMLPRDLGVDRFVYIALNQVRSIPKLLNCSPQSFLGACLEAVKLNLMPGVAGQCWIIPFKRDAVLIPGYRGLVQLAWRTDRIANIFANVIREQDEYEWQEFPQRLTHIASPKKDAGEMIATYAYSSMVKGGEQITFMRDWQVKQIKARAPAAKSSDSPWNNPEHEPEMWKKTGLKRHCKVMPMEIEFARATDLDDLAEAGKPQGLEIDIDGLVEEIAETEEPKE